MSSSPPCVEPSRRRGLLIALRTRSILERASRSDWRDVFAPESRSWDPRQRSDSQSPHVSAPSVTSITEAMEEPSPADRETPAAEPVALPPSPRLLSNDPGPNGLPAPLLRTAPASRGSKRRGRISSSSSSSSASASSPSSPPKKKKKKKHSSHKESPSLAKILTQVSNLQNHFSVSHNNLQSKVLSFQPRLEALESPAKEAVVDDQE